MSYDEAIRACLARGLRRAECDELVPDRMVGGVYCDGTIVLDASGSRCVPRATLDRVAAARASSPIRSSAPAEIAGAGVGAALLVVGAIAAVWLLARD